MERYLLCGEILSVPQSRAVYKGRKRGTVEFYAIHKHDKAAKHRITNGVRLMHGLDHRHVLMFHEWYETPKHIWVITELANGGTLADILEQDGHIPFPQVTDFVRDIASGLSYVHSRQIVYCDLQPYKVILDSCQCLKLSDFSLARLVEEESTTYHHKNKDDIMHAAKMAFEQHPTKKQSLEQYHTSVHPTEHSSEAAENSAVVSVPSPFYVAPEIFSGGQFTFASDLWSLGCLLFEMCAAPEIFSGGQFTVASDLWSLGCLLFEMCAGKRPFYGTSADDLVHRICHEAPDVNAITAGNSLDVREIVNIVSHLLQKSFQQRLSWQQLWKFNIFKEL